MITRYTHTHTHNVTLCLFLHQFNYTRVINKRVWVFFSPTFFPQTMDLSKKEHKTCLDPADTLECKNGRLHKELLKFPRDINMPSLVNAIAYFGTNHAKPASLKMQAKEEK